MLYKIIIGINLNCAKLLIIAKPDNLEWYLVSCNPFFHPGYRFKKLPSLPYFASQSLMFEREQTDLNSSQVRRLIKAGNIARTV